MHLLMPGIAVALKCLLIEVEADDVWLEAALLLLVLPPLLVHFSPPFFILALSLLEPLLVPLGNP